MTETAEREYATRGRSIRMHDDAWALMESRKHGLRSDPSMFTRDMTEAGLGYARCSRCFTLVPVEFGDLTGRSLAEWVEEARETVRAQHRSGHHPVTIGNAAPPSPAPRTAPGSAVFLEPGGKPRAAAAVPEVPASRNKKERR